MNKLQIENILLYKGKVSNTAYDNVNFVVVPKKKKKFEPVRAVHISDLLILFIMDTYVICIHII